MTKSKRMHLCTSGDSFFGASMVACGKKPGEPELATFGETEAIFKQINCRGCMASPEYRAICKEYGLEHPFSTASKKAHTTIKSVKKREISALVGVNTILQSMIGLMETENGKASLADAKVCIDKAMSFEFPKKLIDEVRGDAQAD